MAYETAPQTILLATHCACCNRPLCDATSVERGIGPDCAERYGYGDAQKDPNWASALEALGSAPISSTISKVWNSNSKIVCNVFVNTIASNRKNPNNWNYIMAIYHLGFEKLAKKLARSLGSVMVEATADGKNLVVFAPFSHDYNWIMHGIKGKRFDYKLKARVVPVSEKNHLWKALCVAFPGKLCVGKNGIRRLAR